MRILVIEICNYYDYPTGGQLSFVRNMMKAFGDNMLLAGCTTDRSVSCGRWSIAMIDGKQFHFFPIMRVNPHVEKPLIPKRLSAFFALRHSMRKILEADYDTIFIQSPEVLFALPESVLGKTRIDLPGVNNPLSYSRYVLFRPFAGKFEQLFYKKLSKLDKIWATACSSDIKGFVARSPFDLGEVTQLPTRFDSDIFKPFSKPTAREELGIDESSPVFVTVGRLNKNKGWELMIQAFSLCDFGPHGRLFIIGNGEDWSRIEEKIISMKLKDSVILLGQLMPQEICLYLNAADVFIMGSQKEGWSTTLVEACACGIPCVVTDFSSASDMIENGKNGFVVKNFDEESFAAHMKKAMELQRDEVIEFDRRYSRLAIRNLYNEMYGEG